MNSPESENINVQLNSYNFHLPPNLIANKRDSSNNNLLVVDLSNEQLMVSKTSQLDKFLPPATNFFYNATAVLAARHLMEFAGGRVHEVFYIDQDYDDLPFIKVKIRNLQKLKVGDELREGNYRFTYHSRDSQLAILKTPFTSKDEILAYHHSFGMCPSPPYMDQVSEMKEYQNPLGDKVESVAAPTSCYHFTPELINTIGHEHFFKVYLRVGLGTFEPIQSWEKLHQETYEIPSASLQAWNSTPDSQRCVVGTTALRALESWARSEITQGNTSIFLKPESPPILKFGSLITNFHLPKSSLFILVCSILGKKLAIEAYEKAIQENFKFYSFGDAMLIKGIM